MGTANGKVRGPLHGIPVLLKDNIATGDQMHTTAGAYALKDWRADRDAFLVQNCATPAPSSWARPTSPSGPTTWTPACPAALVPWRPDAAPLRRLRSPGIQQRFRRLGGGPSDDRKRRVGDLRIDHPALPFNSVVALRPSQGLISRDHIIPLGSALDTPGPIGRSLTDVALMLNAMAGVDQNDAKTSDASSLLGVDFTQFLSLDEARKLRVGVIIPIPEGQSAGGQRVNCARVALGRELTQEEQTALLNEEVLPQLGGDPNVAIKALKAMGIEVVEIPDDTLPADVEHGAAAVAL